MKPPADSWRNKIVVSLANFILKFADSNYQLWLEGVYKYGINAAVRDAQEQREPPPHYKDTVPNKNS